MKASHYRAERGTKEVSKPAMAQPRKGSLLVGSVHSALRGSEFLAGASTGLLHGVGGANSGLQVHINHVFLLG